MSTSLLLAAVFWTSVVVLFYTYAGYPALLRLAEFARSRRNAPASNGNGTGTGPEWGLYQPSVAIALAAFNEAGGIERRLTELDEHRSAHRPLVLVGSDGSTDETAALARMHPSPWVELFDFEENRGRAMVHNDLMAATDADIVIFSDVDTEFEEGFVDRIVAPFVDPEVGCVVGRLEWANEDENGSTESMGLYWRMEMALRRAESDLGLLSTGSGAAMAVRRSHWRPLRADEDVDFVTPLHVVADDARVVMVDEAVAYDETAASTAGVLRARARMTSKNLIGTVRALRAMGFVHHAPTWWSIVSHKILRWLSGHLLLAMVASSGLLIGNPFYLALFLGQVAVYTAAAAGHLLDRRMAEPPFLVDRIHSALLPILGMSIGVTRAMLGQRITSYVQQD